MWQYVVLSSITVLILLVVRAIFGSKISTNWRVNLWSLFGLVYLIPWAYEGIVVLWNNIFVQRIEMNVDAFIQKPQSGWFVNESALYVGESARRVLDYMEWLDVVWVSGMFVCALLFLISYVRLVRQTSSYEKLEHEEVTLYAKKLALFKTPKVVMGGESAFTMGWFRPVVVLPKNLNDEQREIILLHELQHIKNRDTTWQLIALAVVITHWYNPLFWIAYKRFTTDIELRCDGRVLQHVSNVKNYASTLVEQSVGVPPSRLLQLTFVEKSALKVRVERILNRQTVRPR
ncbi:MAG: M56 family metallopeptidase, partial [Bacilli bacterium]